MQILLRAHTDPFTCKPLRNLSMAIQAERNDEFGIMRFPNYVMVLKETI